MPGRALRGRLVLGTDCAAPVNRETGHRLHRRFVDSATGEPVPREDQVRGYQIGKDEYVVLEPEEIAAVVPQNDKTLNVSAFVATSPRSTTSTSIGPITSRRPIGARRKLSALIREGLANSRVVGDRRSGAVPPRPHRARSGAYETGLAAITLNYDYEVRAARDAFADVPDLEIKGEMLKLAEHIIETKRGAFDPARLPRPLRGRARRAGQSQARGTAGSSRRNARRRRASDLMAALRESAGLSGKAATAPSAGARDDAAAPRKKAG